MSRIYNPHVLKAFTSDVNAALATKASTTSVNMALATKADVAGQTFTGEVSATRLVSQAAGGTEGGQLNLNAPLTGTTLAGPVAFDLNGDTLRIFESGGAARGFGLDLTKQPGGAAGDIISKVDFTGSNQNIAGNGYQKLPGGLIIQWGGVSVGPDAIVTVTYPIAFPNTIMTLTHSMNIGLLVGGMGNGVDSHESVNLTTFRLNNGFDIPSAFNWVAIGN